MGRPKLDCPNYRLAERGGRFYVHWWEDGRHRRVSTGTQDRRAAERFLSQLVAGLGTPEPPEQPSISAILAGYMADREAVIRSFATLAACAKALTRHLGDLQADQLTKERIRFYGARRRAEGHEVGPPDARRKKPIKDGTILRELLVLRRALAWAVEEKWITDRPHITVPSQPPPRDRWLSRQEAAALIEGAVSFHVRLFLSLALHTAARARALLDLTWDQVDFGAGLIDLGKVDGGKGRAVVPINQELLPVLIEARAAATCPNVIEHGGAAVGSVKTGTRAAARRANLPGVTPHILRHTAATWQAQKGVPMRDIALFLGHGDEKLTARVYAKHSPDYLRRAARALEG